MPPAPPVSSPNLRVALSVSPQPTKQVDPATFTVRVTDATGQPVTGATVAVSLNMPGMDMGENKIMTAMQSSGTYVGTGRITMSGAWQATVTAAKGADKTTQAFPVQVQ